MVQARVEVSEVGDVEVAPHGGIVDAHLHLLPPRLARKVRSVFDAHVPGQLAYGIDPGPVLADLAAAGVTQGWVLPYAHGPGVADWLVPATYEHLQQLRQGDHGVELVLGATAHPDDADPLAALASGVDDLGARVCKLHCAVGGFTADDPRLERLWRFCAERALPVIVHVGRSPSGDSTADDLAAVQRVADQHPDAVLIVAHLGAPAITATLRLLDRHPKLHADLTPVVTALPAIDPAELHRRADRLLFGSDAPNTGFGVHELLEHWYHQSPDPTVQQQVRGGTARRLLAAGA